VAITWRSILPRRRNPSAQAPIAYVNPALGGLLTGDGGASLAHREEILRTSMGRSGTLTAVLDGIVSSVAAVRWHLYRSSPSGLPEDRIEITSHPALAVMGRPNSYMSWTDLVSMWTLHYELVGEAYGILTRLGRIPVEIWPARPDRMNPIPSRENFIEAWEYRGPDGSITRLPVEDVICWRAPNPWDPYHGIGVLQSVLVETESAAYSAEWNRNFFLNSATPGGVIEYERVLSDAEWETQQKRWRASHKGVRNAHRVATIEGGGKWVNASYSMRDMQFAELRNLSSEAIREAFRYPLPLLGTTTDVNRATAQAAVAIRQSEITLPLVERLRGILNRSLLTQYTGTERLEFDFDSPVSADAEAENASLTARTTAAKALVEAGWAPDDILTTVGLPAMEWVGPTTTTTTTTTRVGAQANTITDGRDGNGGGAAPALGIRAEPGTDAGHPHDSGGTRPDTDTAKTAPHQHCPTCPPRAQQNLPTPPEGTPEILSEDPDLTAVQEAWSDALEQLLEDWGPVLDAQYRDHARQVRDAVDSGDTTALLGLAPAVGQALEVLTSAMEDLADEAALQVVEEADEQDATIDPVPVEGTWITDHARVVTALMGMTLAVAAARVALRHMQAGATGAAAAEAVREHLDSLTDAQPRLSLGAALTAVQNQSRISTLAAAEAAAQTGDGPIPAYYASEVLDQNTCPACRWVDRKWLGNSINDVRALYPCGGYVDCEGGPRCRGTVVVVWRPGEDTTKWKEKEPL
jgi:HK97 family phage portal protein